MTADKVAALAIALFILSMFASIFVMKMVFG